MTSHHESDRTRKAPAAASADRVRGEDPPRGQRRSQGRTPPALVSRAVKWGLERFPPGIRSLVGLLLLVAGVFGFLPVLGFWMAPLGGLLIALDIPPLRRKLLSWLYDRPKIDKRD